MATNISGTVQVGISATLSKTSDNLMAGAPSLLRNMAIAYTTGTGINAINKEWHWPNTSTLTTGATHTIDLSGSLTNFLGEAVVFTAIKAIFVQNLSADPGTIIYVQPGSSNGWATWKSGSTEGVAIHGGHSDAASQQGGIFLLTSTTAAGYPVTAGTGDILRIVNEPNSTGVASYYIIILGI